MRSAGYPQTGSAACVTTGVSDPRTGTSTTDYNYDSIGQMTNIVYSDSTPAVSFSYVLPTEFPPYAVPELNLSETAPIPALSP